MNPISNTIKTILICSLLLLNTVISAEEKPQEKSNIKYYDETHYLIEGTLSSEKYKKEYLFDRMPVSFKEVVNKQIYYLSQNAAGITIGFHSNSPIIKVRWELLNDYSMNHMAMTGIKGVDLYYKNGTQWQYLNTGRPSKKINDRVLVKDIKKEWREYKLFLPLYDGVIKVEVGIDNESEIKKAVKKTTKPIVLYGTSITQGGCASRPGMAYPSIMSRKLDIECMNFGFSGNGKMLPQVAEIIAEIDAEIFIMDCTPNMETPELIKERMAPLVKIFREKHPTTPIVFIEQLYWEKTYLEEKGWDNIVAKNKMLKTEFDKLVEAGDKNLYYIPNTNLIGNDHEGTVDGLHFTDLGFMRFADSVIAKLKEFNLVK